MSTVHLKTFEKYADIVGLTPSYHGWHHSPFLPIVPYCGSWVNWPTHPILWAVPLPLQISLTRHCFEKPKPYFHSNMCPSIHTNVSFISHVMNLKLVMLFFTLPFNNTAHAFHKVHKTQNHTCFSLFVGNHNSSANVLRSNRGSTTY